MSGEGIITIATTGLVVFVYLIFKALLKNPEKPINENTPDTFKKQLHIKDKESVKNRIDYWIDNEDYQEALKLCNMYNKYNQPDEEINKRIRYINKLI